MSSKPKLNHVVGLPKAKMNHVVGLPKVKLKVKEHHASGPNITLGAIMDSIKTFC